MQSEKAQHSVSAPGTRAFGLLPRLLFVLLTAAMFLAAHAAVPEQQPAGPGSKRRAAQGGDRVSVFAYKTAKQAPQDLPCIHVDMPANAPPEVAEILASGGPSPARSATGEKAAFDDAEALW